MILDAQGFQTASELFPRLLGIIYFFVFLSFLYQIKPLLGSTGIMPIKLYLTAIKKFYGHKRYRYVPTLFWLNCSDTMLVLTVQAGMLCSILLAFGIWPPLMILLLYILHLSIVSTGQDFLSFGWEVFLLDITFNTFFLTLTPVPNPLIWLSLNLLLFRFHFQGGAVKLQSQDVNWRNLTAVGYHYQTQPLPNTQAWYAHKLPLNFQKFSTAYMFFVELIVPFAIFGPEWMKLSAFVFLASLQLMIWFTGNLSYLNHLTLAFTTILISDYFFSYFINVTLTAPSPQFFGEPILDITLSIVGAILITLQLLNLWEHFAGISTPLFRKIAKALSPFHIVNRYGIFAVMTTKRYEIVIEGSHDGSEWKEYLLNYKPSEIGRRPRRISPLQPRLDWQMWFLPFNEYEDNLWFQNLLTLILCGQKNILSLFRETPFPESPPKYIRAIVYDYEFTSWKEKQATGNWWKRIYVGDYSPTLTLDV